MTRLDIISNLEELIEEITWAPDLTEYAAYKAYMDIKDAIEVLEEN